MVGGAAAGRIEAWDSALSPSLRRRRSFAAKHPGIERDGLSSARRERRCVLDLDRAVVVDCPIPNRWRTVALPIARTLMMKRRLPRALRSGPDWAPCWGLAQRRTLDGVLVGEGGPEQQEALFEGFGTRIEALGELVGVLAEGSRRSRWRYANLAETSSRTVPPLRRCRAPGCGRRPTRSSSPVSPPRSRSTSSPPRSMAVRRWVLRRTLPGVSRLTAVPVREPLGDRHRRDQGEGRLGASSSLVHVG